MNYEETQTGRFKGLRMLLRTLASPNYRLFFAGQGISLIGTWMQRVAMSWLVYRLTGSALLLGVVSFSGRVPIFFLTPLAGVLADRWNRRRILVVTQALLLVQALVLAGLVLSGLVQVWHLIALALFVGLVSALDIPARQAFIVEMIEHKDDLGNAIALNSSLVNSARLIGPSLAGILIAAAGEGVCFLLNGLTYLAVIIALLAMKIRPRKLELKKRRVFRELLEGARYVFGFAPIRAILLLVSLTSLMGISYMVLMPVFAKDVFNGGPHALGFLMAAAGLGALIGALFLASRPSVLGLGRWISLSSLLFGAGLVGFAFSRVFFLSLGLVIIAGFGMMVLLASCNTILQTIVEDDKRGRLMSFYAMSFMGVAPFGSLLAGALASRIGAPHTVLLGALGCIAGSLWFTRNLPELRRLVRPIYLDKGIMDEQTLPKKQIKPDTGPRPAP